MWLSVTTGINIDPWVYGNREHKSKHWNELPYVLLSRHDKKNTSYFASVNTGLLTRNSE